MDNYLTPMLLLTAESFANHWYNTHQWDTKILLEGGIATVILAVASNIPGMGPVAAGLAWIAFVAVTIAPIQRPAPITNLLKIVNGG